MSNIIKEASQLEYRYTFREPGYLYREKDEIEDLVRECFSSDGDKTPEKFKDFLNEKGFEMEICDCGCGTLRGSKSDALFAREKREFIEAIRKEAEENYDEEELDGIFDGLPEVFQRRIERLRKKYPNFRKWYEAYELTICESAVEIADQLQDWKDIAFFFALDFEEQIQVLPELAALGHTPHTLDLAAGLAAMYAAELAGHLPDMEEGEKECDPSGVVMLPFALAPLFDDEE